MRWLTVASVVVASSFSWAAGQQPAAPADRGVILDQDCYWRRYYRFDLNRYSPAAIKADGRKILGDGRFSRLKRDTEKWMRQHGLNPAQSDWQEHVYHNLGGSRAFNPSPTPMPPDDWLAADFDDSSWVRQRAPFQGGPAPGIADVILGQYTESADLRLQAAYYRARFVVADPGAAGQLSVSLLYSGGARVFLNGTEIARGHLPQGELAPDTPAQDYPAQAYRKDAARLGRRTLGPVALPAAGLREGVNVLAIEVRASHFHPIVMTNPIQPNWGGPQRPWPHARLFRLELRPASGGVPSAARRPAGVQVWVEDMHRRVQSSDYLPPGEVPGTIRIVGARNGTFAAQIVIGTDKELNGLQVRPGDLQRQGGGAPLPASAMQVLYPRPYPLSEWTIKRLGDERGLNAGFPTMAQLARYAEGAWDRQVAIFDHLGATAPESVPANISQPVWLSLRIPVDALAGRYSGTVEVSADGVAPVALPVEVEVADWRLPDPADFQTFVACEQNPYGVAKQYGVRLWSDEHFKLLEASFRQLARIGNRWLNVPVLARTEFGNRDDSMVRWLRKRDGGAGFDYGALDRYLDVAVKLCGEPRVIQFVVMQGMRSATDPPTPPQVPATDEATGRTRLLNLNGWGVTAAKKRQYWQTFATALCAHMKARGLGKAMYWGAPLETEADPELKNILYEFAPGIFWTAGGHEIMWNAKYAKNEKFYKVITDIRYQGGWRSFRNDQGWRSKTIHLANPRVGGTSLALHTTSLPFAYRMLADRALAMGRSGFSRVGVDEWAGIHYEGMAIPRWQTGIPVLFVLWPGADGAESSIRFETMLEGIQEAEARIFIEQALERGRVPGPLAARARKMLAENFAETTFFQGNSIIPSLDQNHYRWQERSRRLYRMATEVAGGSPQ